MIPRDRPARPSSWPAADIRRLQILSSRLVTSIFAGEYRSVFRGRGIEFEEVRDYQPGDDIRSIDWNVTARTGRPFVKQYVEEREMTVMLVVDRSASLDCAGPRGAKSRVAAEICALLAFAAVRSHDRIGLLSFTDRIESYVPPAKGSRHAQRLIAEVLRQAPAGRGTDVAGALDYLQRVLHRGSILFLISDFIAPEFRLPLAAAARRHDVVAVSVTDPTDDELPTEGLLRVVDAETGTRRLVDANDAAVRAAYRRRAAEARTKLAQALTAAGVDHLAVATGTAPVHALTGFFHRRQRRRSR
jgi:uncharacterized protein (DUF58 family)